MTLHSDVWSVKEYEDPSLDGGFRTTGKKPCDVTGMQSSNIARPE